MNRDLASQWPYRRDRLVDHETCATLTKFADEVLGPATEPIRSVRYRDLWEHESPAHAQVKRLMYVFRTSAMSIIAGSLDGVGRKYSTGTLISRWEPGATLAPHNDADMWWRTHTGICYLNEDFSGGQLQFTRSGLTIEPRIGMFVAFPAMDRSAEHRVLPVIEGRRYTLSVFQTDQLGHAEP